MGYTLLWFLGFLDLSSFSSFGEEKQEQQMSMETPYDENSVEDENNLYIDNRWLQHSKINVWMKNVREEKTRPNTRRKMRLAGVWEKELRAYGRTDGPTGGPTDGHTLLEMRRRI